ncbi:hypothetical protein BD769DRAFT_1494478 [Suillus cothurnatus]|nr:hypothetical protein BD769DRAFT_1494478 [Suillus cothurnatus]
MQGFLQRMSGSSIIPRLLIPFPISKVLFTFIIVTTLHICTRPRSMVSGMHELSPTFSQSLRDIGVMHTLMVCGVEGLHEVSCVSDYERIN